MRYVSLTTILRIMFKTLLKIVVIPEGEGKGRYGQGRTQYFSTVFQAVGEYTCGH